MTFIAVNDLVNFQPTQAIVGQEVELTAMVDPQTATNKTIEWSMVSGNATIRRDGTRFFLTPHTSEGIKIRATIRNGKQE
jgi:hypothetical protein